MTGALGASSSMRPAGVSSNQLRPSQSSLRPQSSPTNQSPAAQVANILVIGSDREKKLIIFYFMMPDYLLVQDK